MVRCSGCGKEFDKEGEGRRVASISGSIMGDEYTESYFYCGPCGVYTVLIVRDCFLDEESVFCRGPVTKAEGDAKIALINRCAEPWDKKCRCGAHREYFDNQLD